MASMTLGEAQLQLTQVNAAIDSLIQGKTITELKLGNAEFSRWYKRAEVSLSELQAYRKELLGIIATYENAIAPIFRPNAAIAIVARKGNL